MHKRYREQRARYWAIKGAVAYPGVVFTAQFGPGRSLSYRYDEGDSRLYVQGFGRHSSKHYAP